MELESNMEIKQKEKFDLLFKIILIFYTRKYLKIIFIEKIVYCNFLLKTLSILFESPSFKSSYLATFN